MPCICWRWPQFVRFRLCDKINRAVDIEGVSGFANQRWGAAGIRGARSLLVIEVLADEGGRPARCGHSGRASGRHSHPSAVALGQGRPCALQTYSLGSRP